MTRTYALIEIARAEVAAASRAIHFPDVVARRRMHAEAALDRASDAFTAAFNAPVDR